MLEIKTTDQEDSIEKYFCKPFGKLRRYPKNEEMTKMLIQFIMNKHFQMPVKDQPFLFQVIVKRLEVCFTFKINDHALILFLAVLSKTPGTAIMYLTYLQYWCKKHNKKTIDLGLFCEIFPFGFPNDEDLSKIWDQQKLANGSNLLDHANALKSIQI